MEQKPLPPLVSARLFDILRSLDGNVAEWVTEDLLSIHDDLVKEEAERSKLMEKITRLEGTTSYETVPKEQYDRTREVVQALVDALGELRYGAELGAIEWDCQCEEDAGITCGPCGSFERGDAAIALAKSRLQISPTK